MKPLHGGRHSISPEMLAYHQRERLLAGLAASVAEHGYGATTITQITEAAQVSRRTFYEQFDSKQDCFLAAYEVIDHHLGNLIAEATAAERGWPQQVAAALSALVDFFASGPNFARLYLLEAAAAGEVTAAAREQSAERFVALLAPGRDHAAGHEPIEGIEEALVGGIVTLLARRVLLGEAEQLPSITAAVIEFALAPFLGPEQAREVAAEGRD
jgi:AcrR family transcriptional regulator